MSPVAVAPELIGARVPQFMERAGYYFQNWDRLLVNWDKKVRANIADLEALQFREAARCRAAGMGDGRPRARQHLCADGDLRSCHPAVVQDLAISLRIPQPRLRRLSRLLRLPEGTVSGHSRSGDCQDGAGRRGRFVPSRRRVEEARQARGETRRRPTRSAAARSTRRSPLSAASPTAPNGSRPGRTPRIPGSISPPATASIRPTNTGSNISTFRWATSGTTSCACSRARSSTGRPRRSPKSATASPRNMPKCSSRRPAPRSRASSASPARSSPMWRTTISISSIGR